MRCEGWRRNGGAFCLGPVTWYQCKNDATVNLTVKQDGKVQTLPSCDTCWSEAITGGIKIIRAEPLRKKGKPCQKK